MCGAALLDLCRGGFDCWLTIHDDDDDDDDNDGQREQGSHSRMGAQPVQIT